LVIPPAPGRIIGVAGPAFLDNPVWHALTGPHAAFAERVGKAVRYQPDVAVFAGLPDTPGASDWEALTKLVGPGGVATLARAGAVVPTPAGWEEVFRGAGVQMIATAVSAQRDRSVVTLSADDVPQMLDLVKRTDPGPFARRTIELGTFLGVRQDGRLVAMAGERLRTPGYVEVSGVCTDADYRGRGLASALVQAVVADIVEGGAQAVLHTRADNVNAIRLYEQLGFAWRAPFEVVGVRTPN
jgi:ribosomal protein S18 acetylase RimI-like enzyme